MTRSRPRPSPASRDRCRRQTDHLRLRQHRAGASQGTTAFDRFFDLLAAAGTGGNLCTDALIAALAEEHGGTVYSNDADFGRFPGISWKNPL